MAHLQVIVDGQVRYDGEVPIAALPERDEMFPKALGVDGTTTNPMQMHPLGRLTMLTAYTGLYCRLIESALVRGTADVTPGGVGQFTIRVELPDITSMDDVRP